MKIARLVLSLALACFLTAPASAAPATPLELAPQDHIAILGNALPDRMQHSGYFETLIHAYYPQHQLVFRNLSAAGDEVHTWWRSENFGSRDEWLTKVKADVVFAFYGFAESLKGEAGLEQFRQNLTQFIKQMQEKNFSGKGAPRIVLFSPIADEKHQDPNYPDPTENNRNIALYTKAMAELAAAHRVHFVNLFDLSQQAYRQHPGRSLTVNGHYLTPEGDKVLAPLMVEALFARTPLGGNFEELRAAVNEKNWQWHQRYRTIDGYNVYGGRSALAYQEDKPGFISDRNPPPGYISNYQVMQQEMAQRDVLTANRDKKVWALARGEQYTVDDSNLPPVTKVPSNKPGPNPDESHPFLSGEEAISKMTVHSGMKVNLFADEAMFPQLRKPVQMAWDTRGRLWVAVWPNYPERTPTSKDGDSLIILEDTDRDGKADKVTTFLDDLNAPTGFQFYKDGVLVMQAPDLWFVRDTDGDGKADEKERVLMGLDSADSHHTANAICLDPGGAIYLSDGVFHRSQVETAWGVTRNVDAGIYRFEPRTGRFETYINYGFANPHGRVFDYWGNDLVTDATGNNTYFGPAFSGYLDFEKGKHSGMKQFWERPSRPCAATGILTSRHFPEEFQGDFLNLNVISFHGVYRVKIKEDGSGLKGETQENLISSTDQNFRPVAIATGPDGAIYIADWHNPIIGHMQHHLRDPNRDSIRGRIYRITYEGRPLLEPVKIHGATIPELLNLLKEPENQTRELAKVELGSRDTKEVLAALAKWIPALDKDDPEYEHHMMEALWVHQWHNVVNHPLLKRMLNSPDYRARAAAGRVLCYWRDRVPDALSLFRTMVQDESPRVRLEAVRAMSFYRTHEAAEIALLALKKPMDYYLEYCLTETLRQLEGYWRKAIQEGVPFAADNPAGIDRLVAKLSPGELDNLPRTPGVLQAILTRPGLPEANRLIALYDLAEKNKSSGPQEILKLLSNVKVDDFSMAQIMGRLLTMMPPQDLKAVRSDLLNLAQKNPFRSVRESAWAAIVLADDSFDAAWDAANKEQASRVELVSSIPLILDPSLRNKAASFLQPLLTEKIGSANPQTETSGRYVRIELPRIGTLTLAEVQVLSGGRNIARDGKASQSGEAHGGAAWKAIDGKTDSSYSSGTHTHTPENMQNPWWELDLGSEQPIESIVVWNRSADGEALAKRLDGFTLTVLDGQRREVYKRAGIPAPAHKEAYPLGKIDYSVALKKAAIEALVSIPAQHESAFLTLTQLITSGDQVPTAARSLRDLPRSTWAREAAAKAAPALVSWAKAIPDNERTSPDYVQTIQVADELAGLLDSHLATTIRSTLKELRVPVFVVRAVREQMRFDTTRLVVEAGKPFQVRVENPDFMPHNFVIVKPGTREKIGEVVETMKPDQLDSKGRPYVPRSRDIIAATKLLDAGQSEVIEMTAPTEEGVYEFVCTFPGHWQVMWGQFVVTKNVDDYLQKNPQAPVLASADPHAHHGHE